MLLDRLFDTLEECSRVYVVRIRDATNDELIEISEKMGLGLSLDEMKRIQKYFMAIGRDPTDIELQALGQAWSEHCCYKSSRALLKKYIFGVKNSDVIVQFEDDAGVVKFTDDWAYVVKIESHNHPSAIDPYGGAATGVGGIIRDILNMGAEPVALIDCLFFGNIHESYSNIPKGFLHPEFIFNGVVAGIRDYGNRVGIPTLCGLTFFDEAYNFNPLVNVGCLGIVKLNRVVRSRIDEPDINLVLVGGKTGRDGIHGVTFASKSLGESSEKERAAVQLGNPIIKEPLIHAVLEANELGLINGMKDLGGGGLSSVVGEIVHAGGVGAEIHLDRVPLREEDMSPWEIWISESQERMLLGVKDENLQKVFEIFENWDLHCAVIGRTNKSNRLTIYYNGVKVFDLELDFLVSALTYHRPYISRTSIQAGDIPPEPKNYKKIILKILSQPNVRCKEDIIRQYDYEVKGRTVMKPLVGMINKETHSDAAVLKFENISKLLAITSAANPQYAKIDPYSASLATVDEIVRNLVCVGAQPHTMVDCLNFGNPENPYVMGDIHATMRGLGRAAEKLSIPFVSGNVSLYNETKIDDNNIINVPPTATLIGIGIVESEEHLVSPEFKKYDNPIYIIGETRAEFGGSEYFRVLGIDGGIVPRPNLDFLKKAYSTVLEAIKKGYVVSAHDPSHGGIAAAIAEMCIGGNVGAVINLRDLPTPLRQDIILFSESTTRWILEVDKYKKDEFEELFRRNGITEVYRIGYTIFDELLRISGKEEIIMTLEEIERAWRGHQTTSDREEV